MFFAPDTPKGRSPGGRQMNRHTIREVETIRDSAGSRAGVEREPQTRGRFYTLQPSTGGVAIASQSIEGLITCWAVLFPREPRICKSALQTQCSNPSASRFYRGCSVRQHTIADAGAALRAIKCSKNGDGKRVFVASRGLHEHAYPECIFKGQRTRPLNENGLCLAVTCVGDPAQPRNTGAPPTPATVVTMADVNAHVATQKRSRESDTRDRTRTTISSAKRGGLSGHNRSGQSDVVSVPGVHIDQNWRRA
jgi:hypothetical protein